MEIVFTYYITRKYFLFRETIKPAHFYYSYRVAKHAIAVHTSLKKFCLTQGSTISDNNQTDWSDNQASSFVLNMKRPSFLIHEKQFVPCAIYCMTLYQLQSNHTQNVQTKLWKEQSKNPNQTWAQSLA